MPTTGFGMTDRGVNMRDQGLHETHILIKSEYFYLLRDGEWNRRLKSFQAG